MFKVVTDQLKVSQGWVRCGHCSEVFDASLHLQATSLPAAPALDTPAPTTPIYGPQDGFFSDHPLASPSPSPSAERFGETPDLRRDDFDPAGWQQQQAPQLDESGSLRLNDQGAAVRTLPERALESVPVSEPAPIAAYPASLDVHDTVDALPPAMADDMSDVSFVRDARRQAVWRKPLVRIALALLSLLFAALLLLQVAVQQRDRVAVLQPALKPWLESLCGYLHCTVGPLRHIEAIVIDSSSFNKINGDSYRLSFSLKNTGTTPVAMPALEVTLTDAQEQALVRRVLTPAQFGAGNRVLAAGADYSGLVVIQVLGPDAASAAASAASAPLTAATGPLRVAGYRVLAFYP